MKERPLLSVIIPVYKVEAYLRKCVDSVLNQTYQKLEVILVDDGSPDRCPEICDSYAQADPRVSVIHKQNQGQAIARNQALDRCRGEYITFCDSDDWVARNAYGEILEAMERTGASVGCCGRCNVDEKSGKESLGLCPSGAEVLSGEEMVRRMFTWQNCDCSPCDKIFCRDLFEGIRFPAQSGSEDIAILYKLILRSPKTVLVPKPFYYYLQRTGSTSYGGVSEKIFQFEDRTEPLYRDICENYPGLSEAARYLRVRSLYVTVVLLDQADKEQRRRFSARLKKSRREMRSHVLFIIKSPYFSRQERLRDLLMAFDLYRFWRKISSRR